MARQAALVLPPSLVPVLALNLPNVCNLARGERYRCNEMTFRIHTIADNSAKITLGRTSVTLKLPELEYLLLNLTVLANQLEQYRLVVSDVYDYVLSATGVTAFLSPK